MVCGALILLGLLTRIAAIPLIVVMIMAIFSTKIPILLGHGFWGFSLRELSHYGFWSMAHEMRTDWSTLLGSVFLLIVGPEGFPWTTAFHHDHDRNEREPGSESMIRSYNQERTGK
jgi:putative oxidoreductase